MQPCLPPRKDTRKPKLKAPKLACDCHSHIFGPESKYPYTANRSFTPPDALIPEYRKMAKTLGLERTVVVQASVYGSDNRCTAAAVMEMGLERARGIAMVDANVSKEELRALDVSGIRGTRFITTVKGGPTLDNLPGVAKKVAEFGWHIEMYIPRHLWKDLFPVLKTLPVPVVFDHMGGLMADTTDNDPDLKGIMALLESGKNWVKLCGYRASKTGHPYADVAPLGRRFATRVPDRCVWGTDWPHTTLADYMPDDGDLMDLLLDWAPDEAVRKKILVDNPAALYRF